MNSCGRRHGPLPCTVRRHVVPGSGVGTAGCASGWPRNRPVMAGPSAPVVVPLRPRAMSKHDDGGRDLATVTVAKWGRREPPATRGSPTSYLILRGARAPRRGVLQRPASGRPSRNNSAEAPTNILVSARNRRRCSRRLWLIFARKRDVRLLAWWFQKLACSVAGGPIGIGILGRSPYLTEFHPVPPRSRTLVRTRTLTPSRLRAERRRQQHTRAEG